VCPQEFEVLNPLHSVSIDVDRSKLSPLPAEVYHHLFGLRDVDGAPGEEFLDLIPVGGHIIVVNKSNYSGVIRKLDKSIGFMSVGCPSAQCENRGKLRAQMN